MSVTKISDDKPDKGPTFLPPCQVCGGKASGLHYGQYTCAACKGFFRRSITRKSPFTSDCSGSCDIRPNLTNVCSSCRFRKCLLIGMSKSGIKKGRYTHSRRTHNTLEVEKIQQKALTTSETLEQPCIPEPPKPCMSLALDEIIRNMVEGHDKIVKLTYTCEEDIKEKQTAYHEEHILKLELFGQRATLSKAEYDEMYELTGIDIDGRQDVMRIFLEELESCMQDFVAFVKLIPEFPSLSIVDQASLVTSSTSDFALLECLEGINNEIKVALLLKHGTCFHWDELVTVYQSDFVKFWFNTAESLQKLKLKHEEIVILEAVCVLFTDRCDLEEPKKVDDLQWKMIQCLMYLLEKNHKGDPRMFPLVMDRLSDMRVLKVSVRKNIPATLLWPYADKYPLYSEMVRAAEAMSL